MHNQTESDQQNPGEQRSMRRDARLEGCLAIRVHVPSVASRTVVAHADGILCIGVGMRLGMPPLVAICDETDAHGGASATNAMEYVLDFLKNAWYLKLPVAEANIVQHDSMGYWDLVRPEWRQSEPPGVRFLPLKWLETEPRSEAALRGAFGEQAKRMLDVMNGMRASGALVMQP